MKAIERCSKIFGGNYVIVVPDERLYESWKKDLAGRTDCYVYIVKSFTMSQKLVLPDNVQMVIFDEAHHYLNPDSIFFSQAIDKINARFKLLLSATLSKEHLAYAEKLGFTFNYHVPLKTALKLEFITDYKFYNIGVDLTDKEKAQYAVYQQQYKNYLKVFELYIEQNFPETSTGKAAMLAAWILKKENVAIKWQKIIEETVEETVEGIIQKKVIKKIISYNFTSKTLIEEIVNNTVTEKGAISDRQLMGMARWWYVALGKRNAIYHQSAAKFELADFLLKKLSGSKVFLLCGDKPTVEKYVALADNRIAYYSGKSKGVIDKFKSKQKEHLVAIRKIDEGNLDNEVCFGIKAYHTSIPLRSTQQMGRLIRPDKNNKNKVGILINIYVKDWTYNDISYKSQDLIWLKSSLAKQSFIYWCENLDELEL